MSGCCKQSSLCKKVAGKNISYVGASALSQHPEYATNEYLASRMETDIEPGGGSAEGVPIVYDVAAINIEGSSGFLAACGLGGVGGKYSITRLNSDGSIKYSSAGGGPLGGIPASRTKGGGFDSSYRYGWDGYTGAYGVCVYRDKGYFTAWGLGASWTSFNGGNETPIVSIRGEIVFKVATFSNYLMIGTCGYLPAPGNVVEELWTYSAARGRAARYAGTSGSVYIYNINSLINSDGRPVNGNPSPIKVINNVNHVTCMAGGEKYGFYGTRSGVTKVSVEYNSETKNYTVDTTGVAGGLCTGIDALGDDVYSTHANGSINKNGSGFQSNSASNAKICYDSFLTENCFDFFTQTQGQGYYSFIPFSYSNPTSSTERDVFPVCTYSEVNNNTAEQVGSFPSGIGVGSDGTVIVSFFQQGFTIDGKHYSGLIGQPTNCSGFNRSKASDPPRNINSEYTLSCGAVAVGCGEAYIADSVQFTLGGCGPGWYNPVQDITNKDEIIRLTKLWGYSGGVLKIK